MTTKAQIQQLLLHMGVNPMARILTDNAYATLDDQSLVGFWYAYEANLKALGFAYEAEAFDCDDFAILAWALMRISFKRSKDRRGDTTPYSAPFGIFAYEREPGFGNHMVNFAKIENQIRFFEPQPVPTKRREISLTEQEQMSCFAYAI